LAKKKARPRSKTGRVTRRRFHAAKIANKYRYNIRELRELTLEGLTEKQQRTYITGTVVSSIVAGLKKSPNGKVTVSYSYFQNLYKEGEMKIRWADPTLLSDLYGTEMFINDMLTNLDRSFREKEESGASGFAGIGVFRINTKAEKTKLGK
jgi:hypothetical protein